MITWKFNELDITFKSKAPNLIRDISKMGHANHIDPNAEITIINVNGNTNHNNLTDAISSNGDTSTTTQPTISVDTKDLTPSEPEAVQLQPVSGNVDNVDIEPDLLDILDSFGDTDQSGNWLDSEPDGQDAH